MFPNIKFKKMKIGGDAVFTKIDDCKYLTDEIGSRGVDLYIATVVLNLTSIKTIKHVKTDFLEDSQAAPNVWIKEDFNYHKEYR